MGDSLENHDNSVEAATVTIVEYEAFANYIRRAVTILLPEQDVVPPALNRALEDPENQERVKKFLSDPQVQSLYIQRNCLKASITLRHLNTFVGTVLSISKKVRSTSSEEETCSNVGDVLSIFAITSPPSSSSSSSDIICCNPRLSKTLLRISASGSVNSVN